MSFWSKLATPFEHLGQGVANYFEGGDFSHDAQQAVGNFVSQQGTKLAQQPGVQDAAKQALNAVSPGAVIVTKNMMLYIAAGIVLLVVLWKALK